MLEFSYNNTENKMYSVTRLNSYDCPNNNCLVGLETADIGLEFAKSPLYKEVPKVESDFNYYNNTFVRILDYELIPYYTHKVINAINSWLLEVYFENARAKMEERIPFQDKGLNRRILISIDNSFTGYCQEWHLEAAERTCKRVMEKGYNVYVRFFTGMDVPRGWYIVIDMQY